MGLDAARAKQRMALAGCDSAPPARTFGPASEETALDTANIVCIALLRDKHLGAYRANLGTTKNPIRPG